jgi:hypothetical protein
MGEWRVFREGGVAMERVEIIIKCCKCQRVRTDGHWGNEKEQDPNRRRYSHGYCPQCLRKVHAEIDAAQFLSAS